MNTIKALCPLCHSYITLPDDTEIKEVLTCDECNNWIIVSNIKEDSATLDRAPASA